MADEVEGEQGSDDAHEGKPHPTGLAQEFTEQDGIEQIHGPLHLRWWIAYPT